MLKKHLLATALGLTLLATTLALSAAPIIPPLVDPPTNKQVKGRFVWADLFSTDPEASTEFYSKLFGWTARKVEDEGKTYTILSNANRPVAGIARGPQPPDNRTAARWIGYISVPDVKKAADKAKSKKGRIIAGPRMVPDRGMHAIIADPEGTMFGLMTSTAGDPPDFLAEPNEWMWVSLFARDPRRVIPFYSAIGGYSDHDDYRTERIDDFILSTGGYARASVSGLGADSKAAPAWVGFIRVANVKEVTARAVALGAQVLIDSKAITAGNEVALLADPQGGVFGVAAFLEESEAK